MKQIPEAPEISKLTIVASGGEEKITKWITTLEGISPRIRITRVTNETSGIYTLIREGVAAHFERVGPLDLDDYEIHHDFDSHGEVIFVLDINTSLDPTSESWEFAAAFFSGDWSLRPSQFKDVSSSEHRNNCDIYMIETDDKTTLNWESQLKHLVDRIKEIEHSIPDLTTRAAVIPSHQEIRIDGWAELLKATSTRVTVVRKDDPYFDEDFTEMRLLIKNEGGSDDELVDWPDPSEVAFIIHVETETDHTKPPKDRLFLSSWRNSIIFCSNDRTLRPIDFEVIEPTSTGDKKQELESKGSYSTWGLPEERVNKPWVQIYDLLVEGITKIEDLVPEAPQAPLSIIPQLQPNLQAWLDIFQDLGSRVKITALTSPEGIQLLQVLKDDVEDPDQLRPHPNDWLMGNWPADNRVALIVQIDETLPSSGGVFLRDNTWLLLFGDRAVNLGDNHMSKTDYPENDSDELEEVPWHLSTWSEWDFVFKLMKRRLQVIEKSAPRPPK